MTCRAVTVVIAKDNERLVDRWLLAASSRTQDSTVRWNFAPTKDAKTQSTGDVGKDGFEVFKLNGIVGFEEDIADGILARVGQNAADLSFSFSLEEKMGNSSHDAGAVAIAAVSACGATMGHGAE